LGEHLLLFFPGDEHNIEKRRLFGGAKFSTAYSSAIAAEPRENTTSKVGAADSFGDGNSAPVTCRKI